MEEISQELKYAAKHGIMNSFRYCSDKFFEVLLEARKHSETLDLLDEDKELLSTDAGLFGQFEDEYVPLDLPISIDEEEEIVKAEFQGKKVELNKPKKGNVKKFMVFVRDPKTGNVKKVNFGLSVTRDKLSDPKRQAASMSYLLS